MEVERASDKIVVLDEADGVRMRLVVGGPGVGSSVVNAWRRAMMREVETMAIDQLEIHENGTMIHDELLFHRLGYLSIIVPPSRLDSFLPRTQCDCDDGCARCRLKFTLKMSNRSDEVMQVSSHDLVCEDPNCGVKPGIMLAKLHKNQELSFVAYAIKSTARLENNAKWNPTTVAAYRPTALITLNQDLIKKHLTPQERKRVCAAESGQTLEYNEKTEQIQLAPDAALRCTYTGDFIEELASIKEMKEMKEPIIKGPGLDPTYQINHPLISMVPRRDQFLMPVQSTGTLTPREIAKRALAALRKRLVHIHTHHCQ